MMSKKQWFILLCLFIIYLLLGASIFFYIESQEEERKVIESLEERQIIEELLKKHYKGDNKSVEYIFNRLTDYCGKPVHYNMSEIEPEYKWDFYHSLFFVFTVVSTIGYGNLAPTTMFTRIFMIFYALIGIPMNGIVMVSLGEYFGKSFKKLYRRWKNSKIERSSAKLGLIGQVILYSVPGFTFFIFLPSTIMSVFEGWSYDVAVYYSFVTLTTIGFGDYVAGVDNVNDFTELAYSIYKAFLFIWVIGGIGYVVMILGFITQGMKHKRVVEIERMLAQNIKKTPQKIRNELRSVLQEFLFLRVKPVYKGEFEYTPQFLDKSQSCPDLNLWRNMNSPTMMRKRAMSECYKHVALQRVQSDTDLDKIDKELTFKPSDAFMQQKDLLLKVVDALSSNSLLHSDEEGGIHCFSDSEILASEGHDNAMRLTNAKKRRAISDIRPPNSYYSYGDNSVTWYGDDANKALTEFGTHRKRTASTSAIDRLNILKRIKNRFKAKDDKYVDLEKQMFENGATKNKPSVVAPDISRRRPSVLSASQEQVLEQTTIADFIRALSAVTVPESLDTQPKRKMGTASLTPPEVTTPGKRRIGIRSNFSNRRGSLIPPSSVPEFGGRRFSLRPVEENLLVSPPPYSFHLPEARNSFRMAQGRRFSIRPTNSASASASSPVKRQVNRREKTESDSSNR